LELLKLEGLGFSQAEIVNELSQKFACAKRAVVEIEGVKKWRRIVKQERALLYIHIEEALFNEQNSEYHVKLAETVKEACELLEVGFEYVTDIEGKKLFMKRK
jgi:hypothetical protein